MRLKKALKNTISGLFCEFVTLICGLIIPRLVLRTFGSSYNGITNSVTQFLSCIVLLRAGVEGVTKVALYKPLANNDHVRLSEVIKAAERFLHKVGLIYVVFVLLFAVAYPFVIASDFSWLFSFSLVLIIATSSIVENYFGFAYQVLLNADQSYYITYLARASATILNALISYAMIRMGFGIHAVKLGAAIAFSLSPIFYYLYAHRKYKIRKDIQPDNSVLLQRWDAVAHQLAYFVNDNSDIMILTVFTSLEEVSVYSVYYMVTKNVTRLLKSSIAGINDSFGNMRAKNETALIRSNFQVFELVVFTLATILFITTGLMIVPFIMLYTQGVYDVEYSRPLFAAVLVTATFFNCVRIPYQNLVEVYGHFKQTKKGAVIEAILHVTISIILGVRFGLVGVAIGALAATIFRTVQYSTYLSKHIIQRSYTDTMKQIATSGFVFILTVIIYCQISGDIVFEGYAMWVIESIKVVSIASAVSVLKIVLFYRKAGIVLARKLKTLSLKKSR